ncbi:MAG: hypothetical protein KF683_20935 [Rubrivivax sp.]|nr:hypothetical protein [Rubrivivax sp.]
MYRYVLAGALALTFAATPALAADNPQQTRMAACNKQAGDKKGDERKAFMSQCLSNKKMTQQEKMKHCNAEAGDKKGDERKAFMSQCLKNPG